MTATPSIRTAWPGPPPHRHRRAAPPRWSGARRLLLGLLALLAGILALNGVIQAAGSPSRTSSSGHDLDIASLLPPAAAAEAPAGDPAEPVAVADSPKPVARSSETGPESAASPARRSPAAARSTPRAAPRASGAVAAPASATAGQPAASAAAQRPAGSEAERRDDADDKRSEGSQAGNREPTADDEPQLASTPKPAREQADRTGRAGLLPGLGCAVDRVRIDGSPLLGSGCR